VRVCVCFYASLLTAVVQTAVPNPFDNVNNKGKLGSQNAEFTLINRSTGSGGKLFRILRHLRRFNNCHSLQTFLGNSSCGGFMCSHGF